MIIPVLRACGWDRTSDLGLVLRDLGSAAQGNAEHAVAKEPGDNRANQDAESLQPQRGGVPLLECQGRDEQAHRESDAAQERRAVELPPPARLGQRSKSQPRCKPARRHDSDLLAEKQPEYDTKGHRMK